MKRLQQLLELKDFVHPGGQNVNSSSEKSVDIIGATMAWEVEEKKSKNLTENSDTGLVDCLFGLNLSISRFKSSYK